MAREVGIGEIVRTTREARRLSVRALAAATGFSPSFISQVENGQASPSVASLGRIATALGMTLGEFFDQAAPAAPAVVTAADRPRLISSWSRAVVEGLGQDGASQDGVSRALESVLITFLPGGRSGKELHSVAGEQFALVIAGAIDLVLDGRTHSLHPGDSATLLAGKPHRWENAGSEVAQVVIVASRRPP